MIIAPCPTFFASPDIFICWRAGLRIVHTDDEESGRGESSVTSDSVLLYA